ncbi:MAG: hypothetical protein AAF602_19115 [Myxococcota bacterium]
MSQTSGSKDSVHAEESSWSAARQALGPEMGVVGTLSWGREK